MVRGHEQQRRLLANLIASGRSVTALLFCGPCGIGKALVAKEFAGSLLGDPERARAENHPDLLILRPCGKAALHPIEMIRALAFEAALDPLESDHKVAIIEEAHRMGTPAANALLKTLEEPPSNTRFILITHKKERLLPTVLSRCARLTFAPVQLEEPGEREERRHQFLALLDGANHYPSLVAGIETLCADLEKMKKAQLKTLRQSVVLDDLPAAARAAKELEMEGRAQVAYLEEVEYLLEALLLHKRNRKLAWAAAEAYEGIERFSKPAACLAGLFLNP